LQSSRRRFERGQEPSTRYRFELLHSESIPADDEEDTGVQNDRRQEGAP
jgi:hypothetical protein